MSHYECFRKCLFFEHKKQWNCIPYAGMAKGGSIPETPPLESKILENPYS